MPLDQHQNAAILFSDIENYTAMIRERERDAIEMVNRYQKVLDHLVSMYQGQVMQHYGDGSLSVFNNPDDALACALSLQRELQSSIPLRMGLHYGPVVYHQQKVFGDTVNVASRIESLGQPGTVLLSRELQEALLSPTSFKFTSMGWYRFKNIPNKMEVIALSNPGLPIPKPGTLTGKLEPNKLPANLIWALTVITVITLLVIFYSTQKEKSDVDAAQLISNEPAIAVLPFNNLAADSSQKYFAEGLAREVIVLLTQEPKLKVTSHSSSFTFKDRADISSIAERLGVRYILDGNVRNSGDSVGISTELIDVWEDRRVWEQTWLKSMDDIFMVQQEIADSVKNALSLQIMAVGRIQSMEPKDPRAYTLYLQAKHVGQQGNLQGMKTAVNLLEQALSLDSIYAPAWTYLAVVTNRMSNIGAIDPIEGHESARTYAHAALSIDSTSSSAWSTLTSIAIYFDRDFSKAETYLQKALVTDPNNLNNLKLSSNLAFCLGDIDKAIEMDLRAVEIDPVNAKNFLDLGYGYFNNYQFTLAEEAARQGLLMNPEYLGGPFLLSLILMMQQKYTLAREQARSEPYQILELQARELIATTTKEVDSADYFLDQLLSKYAQVAPYQIAQIYANRQLADSAFKWLDLAYQYRDGGLVHAQSDIFMKNLKTDPRWGSVISQMAYPNK